jgi:hypothetical protein
MKKKKKILNHKGHEESETKSKKRKKENFCPILYRFTGVTYSIVAKMSLQGV